MAIVTDNTLDEQGRIEISIEGISAKAGSYPARIASFMAGDKRGALFLPENNDQVLVAFVNGSPNDAIVIGCLWSTVDRPPDANSDGNNDQKIITTRSGNTIRLVDKQGDESIEISDASGINKVTIRSRNNSVAIVAADSISLQASSINIEATGGDLILKGGPNVKLN